MKTTDTYYRKAKKQKRLARAVYKLEEIDQKHRLIKEKTKVLELGGSPGSWSEYVLSRLGSEGRLVSIDLNFNKVPQDERFAKYKMDVFDDENVLPIINHEGPFDVLLSDMAPQTSGNKMVDQVRSMELVRRALELANHGLKPSGLLLIKVFASEEWNRYFRELKKELKTAKILKPSASKKESYEIYLLGQLG